MIDPLAGDWPIQDLPRCVGQRGTLKRLYVGDVLCKSLDEATEVAKLSTRTKRDGEWVYEVVPLDDYDMERFSHLGMKCVCLSAFITGGTPDFWVQFDDGFCMGAEQEEVWFD